MLSLLCGGNTEDYSLNRQVPAIKNSVSLSNEVIYIYIREHDQWHKLKLFKCVCSRAKIVNNLNKCNVLDLTSKLPRKHPPYDMGSCVHYFSICTQNSRPVE